MTQPGVGIARYAVVGNPVAQSRSPSIHALFSRQTGQPLQYGRELIGLDDFEPALQGLADQGLAGANVTVPFKTQAFQWMQARGALLTKRVRQAQAANTLAFDHTQWRADNTDGIGLIADLQQRHGLDLRGARVLMLGAGGAAQGVLGSLLDVGVKEVVIANRSEQRAIELAGRFGVQAVAWEDLSTVAVPTLVINATSAGLGTHRLLLPAGSMERVMGRAVMCYDMVYGATPSQWLLDTAQAGCKRCVDGLGMLVEQAAAAFAFWRGVLPDTDPVYRQLRDDLAAEVARAH